MIEWKPLRNEHDLQELIKSSHDIPCLIFKHSTRCNISEMAKLRLERGWDFSPNEVIPYYLDLLAYRPISSLVAEQFAVFHESPQVLLIKNGECIYDASHMDISVTELRDVYV